MTTRARGVPGRDTRPAAGLDRAARGALRRSARGGGRAAHPGREPAPLTARHGPGPHVPYVPSAALIVRTPVRFDETLRYGEDVDLIWRLLDRGPPRRLRPERRRRSTTSADVLRRRFRYGTSAAPLAARHPTRLRHVALPRARVRSPSRGSCTRKGVPRRVALVWTAAVARAARAAASTNLASPYGIGVLWGKIGGLPTISGPVSHERASSTRPEQAERTTLSGEPIKALYGPEDVPDHDAKIGSSGRVPVHARRLPVDVPRAAVDDAPVRRLRHRRGDQRALPLPARPRPDRA